MDLIVRAFPVIPGKEEQLRAFARELQTRRAAEASEFYARFGGGRARWHLQSTPHGTWIIGVTHLTGMPIEEAAQKYSASEQPLERWCENQVHDTSGLH